MVSCLLCLSVIKDKLDSIEVNSAQWKDLGIAKKIEKHFWSLIVIEPNSLICLPCWHEIDDFHKFYLRVEEAHMKFYPVECKEELVQQTSNINDCDEESNKDTVAYCFLEPEILIDQTQANNIKPETDIETKITEPLDKLDVSDTPFQKAAKHTKQQEETSKDPLEDSRTLLVDKPRKRKHSKINALEAQKQTQDEKSNDFEVKEEPIDINDCDSDKVSDRDDDEYKPLCKASPEKSKKKERQTVSQNRINREENDKVIAEHFKQMYCNICQIPLENFSAMQKHYLGVHRQSGYVLCCNRKFFKRRDLVDHIHCHLNPDYFKCTKCDKVLSDRLRLEKHVLRVHRLEEVVKKYSCDICCKSFLDARYLRTHKLTHLTEEEKKFPCEVCGKFYASAYLLHRHTQAVHLKKFAKICYICGRSVSSTTELKIHMDKHEGLPQPIISCDVCGLRLTTERGLKRHKDSQHPVDGKKDHHCPICPKISPTLKALRKHISTMHEKGYDHKCTICQKAFKRAEVLREHMASHTGTPLYACSWCPKTFNSNGNMHAHRKKVHPKEWEEEKLRKYSGYIKPTINNNTC